MTRLPLVLLLEAEEGAIHRLGEADAGCVVRIDALSAAEEVKTKVLNLI